MPDSDRFESKLWGVQLRKAYRLACSDDSIQDLIPLLRNGLNHLLRNGLDCPELDRIGSAIHGALNRPLFSPEENLRWLSQELDNVSASQNDAHGTRLAINAAKAVFAERIGNPEQIDLESVRRHVRREFTARLLDDQFFSRIREGIMIKRTRGIEGQLDWEAQVNEEVITYRRTSRRWLSSQPQAWDEERLLQPLMVPEG